MSQELQQRPKRILPSLADLNQDIEEAFKQDELNLLCNQPPPQRFMKVHPFVNIKDAAGKKADYYYLPVDKVEFLLTRIFQRWECHVVNYQQIFNSVSVHVKLRVKNPLDGEWIEQHGLGAVGIQLEAGSTASDMSKIRHDAVMKALPAAESYALKDAAEKLGSLFGKDLNKDTIAFTGAYNEIKERWQQNKIEELLEYSTYDHDTRTAILANIETGLPVKEMDKIIDDLYKNQRDRATSGDFMSTTDAKEAVKEALNNSNK